MITANHCQPATAATGLVTANPPLFRGVAATAADPTDPLGEHPRRACSTEPAQELWARSSGTVPGVGWARCGQPWARWARSWFLRDVLGVGQLGLEPARQAEARELLAVELETRSR